MGLGWGFGFWVVFAGWVCLMLCLVVLSLGFWVLVWVWVCSLLLFGVECCSLGLCGLLVNCLFVWLIRLGLCGVGLG